MTADPEPKVSPDAAVLTAGKPRPSLWDGFLWPGWLPIKARLPLVGVITGFVALTALLFGPWWAQIPQMPPVAQSAVAPVPPTVPLPAPVRQVPPAREADATVRPAHLNLDVRHSFNNIDLSVSVDGKSALETQLEGNGKRFKVFGKRAERSFTKTIELTPGVRVVRVRVQSKPDKFDQTRVERFDLDSASVAALQISADRSGLTLTAKPPSAAAQQSAAPAPATPASAATPAAIVARADALAATAQTRQEASATGEVLQSLRSMLIAIAGFVASTATAFVIQEFLRSRKELMFTEAEQPRRGAPSV